MAPFKKNIFNPQLVREYETLNLFGYSYFGNYNSGYRQYLKNIEEKKAAALFAAQSANGYEITGTITDAITHEPLIGVSIMAGNFAVGQTLRNGDYKIKVPVNSVLNFRYIGYRTLVVEAIKAGTLNLAMKESNGTDDVVIRGYVSKTREMTTGSSYIVNGYNVQDAPVANVEELLQGKVAGLNIQNNTGSPGMRGATNIRGYTPITPLAIEPVIRTNFNETAFFYPHLRTDENGEILISFTMAESLTRWKFRSFAHTKDLATGSMSTEVVTQKQLTVMANMPRFLKEDDTITVSARVANLSKEAIKGQVELKLFNASNMQPINILVHPEEANQSFDLAANTNKAVSFKLIIPTGLEALTYRITAVSDHFSDGEENTLPVLSNQVLVTESMPMMVRPGENKAFTFEKFVNQSSKTLKNKTLTLEYTQNPAWYAVQSMPYLMEFPYECTEQIFSRYYANSFSAAIVNRHPKIKQVFELWKAGDSKALLSNLEKNQELKSVLLEETPWLRDATDETERKKRIALLFDLNNMSAAMELNLDQLQKKQLPNGAFPWFGGNYGDRYITQHILAGIGQLYHLKIADGKSKILESIRIRALNYLDDALLNDQQRFVTVKNNKPRDLYNLEIHAWYTRSYFPDTAINEKLKTVKQSYVEKASSQWKYRSIYEQGMIALTLQRSGKPEVARQIMRSLLETAQQSKDLGMYWAGNRRGWFWYEAPIETQSLLIELFTEVGNQSESVAEMKIWLLRNKQTNNWRTTKATAAACYALLMKDSDLLRDAAPASIKLDGKSLSEIKPEIKAEAGTGYLKTTWVGEQIKPVLGKVTISNNSKIVNWGAMYWQYTEKPEKVTAAGTDITLKRKYFIEKSAGSGTVLTTVDAQHQPKTGDLLKVVVYLQSGRDYEYVHLKDLRPSGTEPVDVLSAFKYQDGLYYYQATKDVATNFFISRLNKGSYVFEYRLRVVQPGNFATGITTAQSMYAPEFNANSAGGRMDIRK